MKTVIIVNGRPRAGKDTAIEFMRRVLHRERIATAAFSSIDPIREMLVGAGFDIGAKTEGDRKLLSVVGDAVEEHSEYRTNACLKRVMQFVGETPGQAVMFLHIREPHLIERLRHALRTYPRDPIAVRTLRVASEARGLRITSNASDGNVDDFDYDITIHNEGSLADLHGACRTAVAVMLATHCHDLEINI